MHLQLLRAIPGSSARYEGDACEDSKTRFDICPPGKAARDGDAKCVDCAVGYFAPVEGETGQRADRQLNTLQDVQKKLPEGLLRVRNGYSSSPDVAAEENPRGDAVDSGDSVPCDRGGESDAKPSSSPSELSPDSSPTSSWAPASPRSRYAA